MSDPVEFEAGAATYSVSLPQFEGPLDLLLHLCQKHELDILDIPMGFITKKYLEYLDVMTHMQLDVASEYLLMAATLTHIKSKMLLPLPPPGQEDDASEEEEEDPREALIRRLLEYQKYKLAAAQLEAQGIAAQNVFLRGAPPEPALGEPALPPLAEIPLFRLIEAFQGVLAKSKVKIGHDIVADRISITDRIHELLAILETRRQVVFEELFEGLVSKFDLVITFLALLEMTRLRMTRLFQTDASSPLYVEYRAAAGDPLPEGLEAPSTASPPPTAHAAAPTEAAIATSATAESPVDAHAPAEAGEAVAEDAVEPVATEEPAAEDAKPAPGPSAEDTEPALERSAEVAGEPLATEEPPPVAPPPGEPDSEPATRADVAAAEDAGLPEGDKNDNNHDGEAAIFGDPRPPLAGDDDDKTDDDKTDDETDRRRTP
ncbi:MAG: segregation/condensation protein A [Myxococcales bacterium]|nr:segregation/condensation protein A [Myxococcales bacterium]HQY63522.1 segregation/condensation protein A [Polyangiaceae bacterium]